MAGTASIKITGNVTEALAALDALGIKAEETGKKTSSAFDASSGAGSKIANFGKIAALGLVGVGVASIKMAGDFQSSMTQLVTGAGESQKNIKSVSDGILNMAPQVGETTKQLTDGMFLIESAGFHGADGLNVLRASAEGAKVGGADLQTVANGVTTVLTDYHMKASDAAAVTSQLVETVASGKTHMQDLSAALSNVLPVASANHVAFTDVAGALATMTGQGISADESSQMLANTYRSLGNIGPQATQVLDQFGLSATTIEQQLGQRGLQGTLSILVNTITSQMGPSGLVLQDSFKQAATASADAKTELAKMPAGLQDIAKAYMAGTITQAAWRKDLKGLPVDQRELASQFAATVNASRGFNDSLKSGTPAAKTLSAVLSEVLGGATGLNTALALSGPNMATYQTNTANIFNAAQDGAKSVQGWADVQKDFNFKLSQAKETVETLAIRLGQVLIPVVERVATVIGDLVVWLEKHRTIAMLLAGVVGTVLVSAFTMWAISAASAAVATIAAAAPILALVAGVALVAVGIYELVTNWTTVWDAIKGAAKTAWDFLKGIFDDGVNFVKNHWRDMAQVLMVVMTGGIGLIPALIWRYWSQISGFTEQMWSDVTGFVSRIWHDVTGFFTRMWTDVSGVVTAGISGVIWFFGAMPGEILNTIWHLLDDFYNFGKNLVQKIIDGIGSMAGSIGSSLGNLIKGGINSIPGVGSLASAFGFAEGGVVTRPTLAMIGEGGETEYVIPESWIKGAWTSAGVQSLPSPGTSSSASAAGSAGGGDLVLMLDGQEFARVAGPALRTAWLQGTKRNATRVGFQ